MSKVITFSRTYPSYHPKAGQPTNFVQKIWRYVGRPHSNWCYETNLMGSWISYDEDIQPKFHTIRAGHRWKAGDWFSPRVWSGKPYRSKMIQFAPDIQIKKVWDFRMVQLPSMNLYAIQFFINGKLVERGIQNFVLEISKNDGLSEDDFIEWFMDGFNKSKTFMGQIICWNENINY